MGGGEFELDGRVSAAVSETVSESSGGDTPSRPGGELPEVDRGHYEVGAEFARGGLGQLRRARDLRLGRVVAIKQLHVRGDHVEARFRREAQITARLQHPGIVPVHEAGRWPGGEPFYVMKLVVGKSLKDVVLERPTLDERLALVPNVLAVAEAVAYAHSQRVIHRDLKPSNIMVGAFGETVVIDWGLAKELDEPGPEPPAATPAGHREGELTEVGRVLGTASYIPPEQARGEPVSASADVYALGAVLYFVLAGQPPYPGAHTDEVLAAVRRGLPPALAQREPGVPRELSAIVARAMSRQPAQRYATAEELAQDLRRFLTGQLVSAHRYPRTVMMARWLRRHRREVAVAGISLVLLLGFAFIAVSRIVRARASTAAARAQASARDSDLVLARAQSWLDLDPTATVAWLARYAAGPAPDRVSIANLAQEAGVRGVARHVFHRLRHLSLSPDGRLLAGLDGTRAVLITLASGARRELDAAQQIKLVRFSPDGRALVGLGEAGVSLWNLEDGSQRRLPTGLADVSTIALSPDGQRLAVGGEAGELRVIGVASGAVEQTLVGHTGRISRLRFSLDGAWLVTAATDGAVRLWRRGADTGEIVPGLRPIDAPVFSPASDLLAWGAADGTVQVRGLATGVTRVLRGHSAQVVAVAFNSKQTRLASASADESVRIWDLGTGTSQQLPHGGGVGGVWYLPGDRQLVSVASDRELFLWDVLGGRGQILRGHNAPLADVEAAHDSLTLVSGDTDGEVRVWALEPPPERILKGPSPFPDPDIQIGPDGMLVSPSGDGRVLLWNVTTGHAGVLGEPGSSVPLIALSPNGRAIAAAPLDGSIALHDLDSRRTQMMEAGTGAVHALAFSPDGHLLAAAGEDPDVRLWDLVRHEVSRLEGQELPVWRLAFSPDGRWLASAGDSADVRVWDLPGHTSLDLVGDAAKMYALAFSPDGHILASGGPDATVRLWNPATGASRLLEGHSGLIWQLAFAPDATRLASASGDRTARLWSLHGGPPQLFEHSSRVDCVAMSPDGKRLATGSRDGRVRLWDVASGELEAVLGGHAGTVSKVVFAPDGTWLASSGADSVLRIWPLAPPGVPHAVRLEALTSAVIRADGRLGTPLNAAR